MLAHLFIACRKLTSPFLSSTELSPAHPSTTFIVVFELCLPGSKFPEPYALLICTPHVTGNYWASQQLVGRAFVCLLQELASQPSQPALLPTAEARLATPGLFSENLQPARISRVVGG